jgi:uncharacterized membrane protein
MHLGKTTSFVCYCLCTHGNTASFVCYCLYTQGNTASLELWVTSLSDTPACNTMMFKLWNTDILASYLWKMNEYGNMSRRQHPISKINGEVTHSSSFFIHPGNTASFVCYCVYTQGNTASFVCYCPYIQGNAISLCIKKLELWVTSVWYPRLQYYDVQTLEYRYISKLPMKNERIWSYVKKTTSQMKGILLSSPVSCW